MDLVNDTPFAARLHLFLDDQGLERLLLVVKATWSVHDGKTAVAQAQVPVAVADEYRGDPACTSLRVASDLAPFKPATDVLVQGFARTRPGSRTEVLVAFRVGSLTKGVRVSGDRAWERTLGLSARPQPQPFLELELCHERAFGGAEALKGGGLSRCDENPVGVGYRDRGSQRPVAGSPLPNLEDPANPMRSPGDRPRPFGVGPVAPHWAPRSRHAGTYDEAWRRERFPLHPADFDPRFHQVAPPDQILPAHLRGGEPVVVSGLSAEGGLSFALPALRPRAVARVGDEEVALPPGACDTLVIDGERATATLVWRTSLPVQGKVDRLRWVAVDEGERGGG